MEENTLLENIETIDNPNNPNNFNNPFNNSYQLLFNHFAHALRTGSLVVKKSEKSDNADFLNYMNVNNIFEILKNSISIKTDFFTIDYLINLKENKLENESNYLNYISFWEKYLNNQKIINFYLEDFGDIFTNNFNNDNLDELYLILENYILDYPISEYGDNTLRITYISLDLPIVETGGQTNGN